MFKTKYFALYFFSAVLLTIGCKKKEEDYFVKPPEQVHFESTSGSYVLTSATPPAFKIPVYLTQPASTDRKITYTVSSPTGAAAGSQYVAPSGTITIPAGKLVDTISITGIYAGYTATRKDTLVITLTGGDIPAFNREFKLVVQRACPVVLTALVGTYANTNETLGSSPYGPYTTTISSATSTGATSARITVTNIFDFGWGPIEFDLDWSNPLALTATVVAKSTGIANASTLDPSFAGQQVAVRPFAGQPGTFSPCEPTLTLRMQLGASNGTTTTWFTPLYTVTMAK